MFHEILCKSLAELMLSACTTVVNPRQMFHPTVPYRESRKRPLSPTFMVRLGILYRTHVELSHDELCAKQRAITTQTRFIVLIPRKLSALSFQKSHQSFNRLSLVRVSSN